MYSRLLVNAVTDDVLLIVSAICLSVIEIAMRLTVFQRDIMLTKLANKIRGVGKGGSIVEQEAQAMYRKQIIVLQSVCELCDVVVMSSFFALLLQVDGPLQYAKFPKIQRKTLRSLGFHIEDFILQNLAVQLVVEIVTDVVLTIIEQHLGINALSTMNPKNNLHHVITFTTLFTVYGFFSTGIFVALLFVFPVVTKYQGSVAGYDLDGTWIYYMPNAVEVTYATEYLRTL
eukprot:CAMPEP_0183816590 /NCGR_PEP_ID=MMETSP0803_2-20130417/58936_1 /TAXON_ID=195967 /ORGANISM="Crustomastix stigmata, Strain CCMP3273" /LENGTH=229 /DNA_ID=CAMNT_0026061467 /DNA_START=1009 /DNA_END=1698 /DNA_ORIENTATION=-